MSLNRRHALKGSAALAFSTWGGTRFAFAGESDAVTALKISPLIYLSPLVSNGRESHCHAEVWFLYLKGEIFIVTWAEKWKARAMRRGFQRAKIWIGDFGPWKNANERYLSAPSLNIEGKFESDASLQSALLLEFAHKYKKEWHFWDQKVRDGLVNGEWVMLRYQIIA